ncbi:hypothetical protein BD779DRAFT_1666392 [Infundibulicybe gibba]|nr:hypothetical protein BD779DRAFT_1666392 [Infundibulicybe gibba]
MRDKQGPLSINRNRFSLVLRPPPPSFQDIPPPPKSAPAQTACIGCALSAASSNVQPHLFQPTSSSINPSQSRIGEKRVHPTTILTSYGCQLDRGFNIKEDPIEDELVLTKSLRPSPPRQSLSSNLWSPAPTKDCIACDSTLPTCESPSNHDLPKLLSILIPENSDSQSSHSESPITFADSSATPVPCPARLAFLSRPNDKISSIRERDTWMNNDQHRRSLDLMLSSTPPSSTPFSEGTARSLKRSQSMWSWSQIHSQNHHQIDQDRVTSETYAVLNKRGRKMIQIPRGVAPSTHPRRNSDSISSSYTKISTLGSGGRPASSSYSPSIAKTVAQDEIEFDTRFTDIMPEHFVAMTPPLIGASPSPELMPQTRHQRARFTRLFRRGRQDSQTSKPDSSTKRVKVKMTGHRFWGFMDRRPRLKEVDMVDVIGKLRNLRTA